MTDIVGERAALRAQGLDIVEREAWGAVQKYTSDRPVTLPAVGFVLHVSVTQDPDDLAGHEDDSMRAIERIGQERFKLGFPYNAAAFDTGRLYEGAPLTRRAAHTVNTLGTPGFPRDMNYAWRGLCLPQLCADEVTDAQVHAAARWAAAQCRSGLAIPFAVWSGHRDYAAKSCPCDLGYARIPELNALTRYYEARGLDPEPPEGDPMAFMVRKASSGAVLLVTGNAAVLVTSQAMLTNHRAAGIPGPVECDDNQFSRYQAMRIDD